MTQTTETIESNIDRIIGNLEQLTEEQRDDHDKWRIVKHELIEICELLEETVDHLESLEGTLESRSD